jgi:hypothetical protein
MKYAHDTEFKYTYSLSTVFGRFTSKVAHTGIAESSAALLFVCTAIPAFVSTINND